ncbi:MAG TPA: c-type cytochrome [Steroidobacteraceae bacterium]|nr:c-type cytochrome [Steroidobacteraceae bacterium]
MIACAAVLRLGIAWADDAEAAEGKIKFNTYCRTCHSYIKGDNRLGPSLYGVVGRKAGTAAGYMLYSQGMKESGIVWTEDMIDKWITDPYKILPNTNMKPFPGVPDPETRKKIIAFLKSNHD